MCDIQNELEIQEIGRIRAALEKAVPLKFTEGVIQEMKNAGIPMVLQGESVVFALRELGSGFVIVVGSIDHWSNRAIAKADNILFLDYVQTTFRNALISPQRQ